MTESSLLTPIEFYQKKKTMKVSKNDPSYLGQFCAIYILLFPGRGEQLLKGEMVFGSGSDITKDTSKVFWICEQYTEGGRDGKPETSNKQELKVFGFHSMLRKIHQSVLDIPIYMSIVHIHI